MTFGFYPRRYGCFRGGLPPERLGGTVRRGRQGAALFDNFNSVEYVRPITWRCDLGELRRRVNLCLCLASQHASNAKGTMRGGILPDVENRALI